MTLENFKSKLNWRQILIHFVASWFFIHAFHTLSYLYDTKVIDVVRQSNGKADYDFLIDSGVEASDLTYFLVWTSISEFIGLVVAFLISLAISIRRRLFWVNALLAFIIASLLYRWNLLGWTYLKQFYWYLGQTFNSSTVEYLFYGIALLTIGLLIFFLKRSNEFIENGKVATR
jgi:hypothetical protein